MAERNGNPNPNSNPNSGGEKRGWNGKPYDLTERTLEFADRVLDIVEKIPRCYAATVIRIQLGRAGSSIGANWEEADGSETEPDRKSCTSRARKEARESRWWLRLAQRRFGKKIPMDSEIREADELVKIFSAIIRKMK